MSWIGIIVLVIGVYLAIKVVGLVFKLAIWALVVGSLYWLVAPFLGLPLAP